MASSSSSSSLMASSSSSSLMASSSSLSLMASSSSSSPHNWKYDVFTSVHGPDVRNKFLTHLRKQFDDNGITMFDDNRIERSQIIATALKKAIKESWIAIVLLSKNYASSSWCLDELLEIFECKEDTGKIVMPVFYEVDPSDVRHQTGDFGIAFRETCARYTDVKRREWSQALTYVSNIAGEHFKIWMNEAKMIEKIAKDVLLRKKSYVTPGNDFDGMVGLDEKKVLFIHNNKVVLADIKWYGPRVIVTTENKEIFQQHGISDIYHEDLPWESVASMIFCQRPLRVLGSSLRGNSQAKWIDELPSLRNRLEGDIESILKVSFENIRKKAQSLFLYIAVFFNHVHADHVTSMLAKTNLDVRLELIILADKSLIHVDPDHESRVVMHRCLQVMARKIISRQEPWKRQILVDAREICYLLENAQGDGSIVGVSFNVAEVTDLIISASAFERMCNLVFLKVYGWRPTRERKLHIPEEMEFPPGLRLLDWDAYPKKSLPLRFCTENLVELHMVRSKLEKLWEGTKALANLKIMNLLRSSRLKELPNLSKATNLERLDLSFCTALVELPASIRHCSRLEYVDISGSGNLKSLKHLPKSVTHLKLSNSGIERITDCIKGLHNLHVLNLSACKRLVSLPELPRSLKRLVANDCDALERVNSPLNIPDAELYFTNCFKLDGQARRAITQQSFVHGWAFLPGREVPAEFDHRDRRSSLTFSHTAIDKFKVCVVISPNHHQDTDLIVSELLYDCKVIGNSVKLADMNFNLSDVSGLRKAHMFIFHSRLSFIDHYEVRREMMVQFSISCKAFNIIECGIQILADDSDDSNNGSSGDEGDEENYKSEASE